MDRNTRKATLLSEMHLDAYVAWKPEELVAWCGYYPHWGASVALLLDADTVLFVPAAEPRDAVPANLAVVESPWGSSADPWRDLATTVAKHLPTTIGRPIRVGYDPRFGRIAPARNAAEGPPPDRSFVQAMRTLSGVAIVDASRTASALYARKSADEIDAIARANRVADRALSRFYELLHPGVSEAAVAAEVETVIHRAVEQSEVAYARGWALVQSGPETGYAGTYNRSTGRILTDSDLVTIELATCVDGYWSDLTRTGVVGKPSARQRHIHAVVREAQEAALDRIRPGTPGHEPDAAARRVVAGHDLEAYFPHPLGHQTGFRYHDEGPVLAPDETRPLEAGMVVTVEPGIYLPHGVAGSAASSEGCRVEDNVVVTAEGCRLLSHAPRDLGGGR